MNALWAALSINPANAIVGLSEANNKTKTIKILTNQSNYRLSEKGEAYNPLTIRINQIGGIVSAIGVGRVLVVTLGLRVGV